MALVIRNSRGQVYNGVLLDNNICTILFDSPNNNELIKYSNESFINLKTGLYNISSECLNYSEDKKHSIFMGGDHLTSFGTVLASLRKYGNNFKLVWMDAHTDIHSFESSVSWNMHGMVVRLLMTHTFKDIPTLKAHQIIYIGARSIDTEEMKYIRENNISVITMTDWQKNNYQSLEKLGDFIIYQNVHISIDVDVLDPNVMSSTGTPVENGMYIDDIKLIIALIRHFSKKHFATDIMEFNPKLGDFKTSLNTIKNLISYL
jgi:arginase